MKKQVFIYSNGNVSFEGDSFSFIPLIAAELQKRGVDLKDSEIETVVNGQTKYLVIDPENLNHFHFTDF